MNKYYCKNLNKSSNIVLENSVDTVMVLGEDEKLKIEGAVICKNGNADKKLLSIITVGDRVSEFTVQWHIHSPWKAKKYPNIPDSNRSRFSINNLPSFSKLSLFLVTENGEQVELMEIRPLNETLPDNEGLLDFIRNNIELLKDNKENKLWRDIIDGIPASMEDVNTLMSSVLLNCMVQSEPKQTFFQIEKISHMMDKQETDFLEFWKEISSILSPMTINSHGYKKSLKSKDSKELWKEIEKTIALLRGRLGLDIFIISGTLLGLIRDGDFIGHDDDVDLAVMLKSDTFESAGKEWNDIKCKLSEIGILVDSFNGFHAQLKGFPMSIDLFPAWIIKKHLYIFPHTFGEVDESVLYPLNEINVKGANVAAPNKPEEILALNYGDKWRHPDPSWSFDWMESFKKFDSFIQNYKMARGAKQ